MENKKENKKQTENKLIATVDLTVEQISQLRLGLICYEKDYNTILKKKQKEMIETLSKKLCHIEMTTIVDYRVKQRGD